MKVVVSAVAFSKNEELVRELTEHFPDATINKEGRRFSSAELIDFYVDADVIITGLEKIDEDLLALLPRLKFIAKYGVGLDNVDLEACRRRSIGIGWTAGVNKESVAEMTLGLMIMLSRNLYTTSNQLKAGNWNKSGGKSLSEITIGIIGVGNIGEQLITILRPLAGDILVNDIRDLSSFAETHGVKAVSKPDIYKNADIISIHTPLTDETRNMINADNLSLMKAGTYIINTSRGGIVNEQDLLNALVQHRIAGAALDVYAQEPPVNYELLKMPMLITTPHIAGNSRDAVLKMGRSAIGHILTFFNKHTGI